MIFWAKEYRYAIDSSLQGVVNAHSKSASNVGAFAVAVNGGEHSYGIYYEHISSAESLCSLLLRQFGNLCVEFAPVPAECFKDALYMAGGNLVRHKNQFYPLSGEVAKLGGKEFLIGRPGASGYYREGVLCKCGHCGYWTAL